MARSGLQPISLALQGGGSHGAFQWGVLDRLLEADVFEIKAVTSASAGAMNGAALVSGLAKDGTHGARAALDNLWQEVNRSGGRNIFGNSSLWSKMMTPDWLKDSLAWRAGENFAMSMSPYAFNPFNLNPLKTVIEASIDFEAIRASDIELIISATSVQAGRTRLFRNNEMSPDVLLASACLPHLFQAVEINGEPYWDGGYLANPAIWPLFESNVPKDILILPLNPFRREDSPREAGEIMDRLNEILFNAPLVAELRSLAFVQDLIDEGRLTPGDRGYSGVRIHAVEADEWLSDLSTSSKFDTEISFLTDLKSRGRQAAEQWLTACAPKLGQCTSVDLKARFL